MDYRETDSKLPTKLNSKLHSFDDLPALVVVDGTKFWYKHGMIHRDGDLPAIVADGWTIWYKNNKIHRDGDLPAHTKADGAACWYKHGMLHRDNDLPAMIFPDGTMCWCIGGVYHRDGKPAVVTSYGRAEWHTNGIKIKECNNYIPYAKSARK